MTRCAVLALFLLFALPLPAEEGLKETEPNDDMGAAQAVASNSDILATIGVEGDTDWFKFEAAEPVWVRVTVTGAAGADFSLSLQDPEGNVLMDQDGQGVGKPEELVRYVRRGANFLRVTASGAAPGTPYALRIREVNLLKYEPSTPEIKAAIRKGLAWLATQQKESGEWSSPTSDHGVTGLALMAFVGEGLAEFEGNVAKAVAWFTKSYIPPGAYPDDPESEASRAGCLVDPFSQHMLYEQAIAVLALVERWQAAKDAKLGAMVKEGVALLVRSQNTKDKTAILHGPVDARDVNHGGWRYRPDNTSSDLSASGWCLIALLAAAKAGIPVPESVTKDYVAFCRRCFDEERGMYAYGPGAGEITNTTNAVGVLTTLLTVGGTCPVVGTGLRSLRKNMPGWEAEGGPGKYPFYYWYYGSRAMYVAGGDWWKEWQAVVCPMLLDHQNPDGSWDAAQREEEVGKAYSTAMAILILQLCSGNPPAYLEGLKIEDLSYPCPRLVDDIETLVKQATQDERTKEDVIRQILLLIRRYRGE